MKPGVLDVNMPLPLVPPMDKNRGLKVKRPVAKVPVVKRPKKVALAYSEEFSALPLEMRTGKGLFGAPRGIDRADVPGSYATLIRFHQGVDLLGRGADVYAASNGTVVSADSDSIVILHEPWGCNYVTRYMHLGSVIVTRDDHVIAGQMIGRVNNVDSGSHLHFEIRRMFGDDVTRASDRAYSAPIDPTSFLYRWEGTNYYRNGGKIHVAPKSLVHNLGQLWRHGVSYFQVLLTESKKLFEISLYAPTPEELSLIELLRLAFQMRAKVTLTYRDSLFFGGDKLGGLRNVIIGVEIQ
jgi:hypothetical protein